MLHSFGLHSRIAFHRFLQGGLDDETHRWSYAHPPSRRNWFVRCADARGYEAYAILSLSCMNSFFNAQNNDNCLAVKRADAQALLFLCRAGTPL